MRITTIRLLAVLAFAASGTAAFAQTADNLAGYAGRYSGFAGSPNYIDVTAQDGALRFQPTGQSPVPATAQPAASSSSTALRSKSSFTATTRARSKRSRTPRAAGLRA